MNIEAHADGPLRSLRTTPAGEGPHPVLIFLHGYNEGAPARLDTLQKHGPLKAGNDVAALERFIVVAPQLPRCGDIWRQYADAVAALVADAHARGGDPTRSYLTGFSFGGNGVFDLALAQPGTWAALWAVDPTRVPVSDPQRPIWLSVGEAARHLADTFVRALALNPLPESENGDRIYVDEGEDHVGSATRAYRDARIYDWLLSKRVSDA